MNIVVYSKFFKTNFYFNILVNILKIQNLSIYNFRSIKHFSFSVTENVISFIGKNSAGKSNILKAINLLSSEEILAQEKFNKLIKDYYFSQFSSMEQNQEEIDISLSLKFDRKNAELFSNEFLNGNSNFQTNKDILINLTFDPNKDTFAHREVYVKSDKGYYEKIEMTIGEIGLLHRKLIEKSFIYPKDHSTKDIKFTSTKTIDDKLVKHILKLDNVYNGILEEISTLFRRITGIDAEILATNDTNIILVRDNLKEPISFLSSGTRRTISILTAIAHSRKEKAILILEEPELYLDPKTQRKLSFLIAERLQENQQDEQQIILTTQSPKFMFGTTFICKFSQYGTVVKKLSDEEAIEEIITLFGIRPSDSLGADVVLFVEGITDVKVLQVFENKLKKKFPLLPRIAYVPVDGWTKLTFTLSVRILQNKYARSKALALVDGDTKKHYPKLYYKIKSAFEEVFGKNSFLKLNLDCIESVLLQDPKAIAKYLKVDENEIIDYILMNEKGKNDKRILQGIIKNFSEGNLKYRPHIAEGIARNLNINKIPIEFEKILESLSSS